MRYFFYITTIALIFAALPFFSSGQVASGNDFPLDVMWEADTYVPANFKGKALPVGGVPVRMVALTPTQNPNNIEFSWSVVDGSSFAAGADLAGRGENEFSLFTERIIPRFTHEIRVTARNVFTGAESRASVEIPLQQPEVLIQHSNTAASERVSATRGKSLEFFALPLYFSVDSLSSLLFSWQVGGSRAQTTGRDDVLMLRIAPDAPVGTQQSFGVTVENQGDERSYAQKSASFIITQ